MRSGCACWSRTARRRFESTAIFNGFIDAGPSLARCLARPSTRQPSSGRWTILANAETIYPDRQAPLLSDQQLYGLCLRQAAGEVQLVGTAAGIDDDLLALARRQGCGLCGQLFALCIGECGAGPVPGGARHCGGFADRFGILAAGRVFAAIWFEVVEADHAGFRSLSASMAFAMALTVVDCREAAAEPSRHCMNRIPAATRTFARNGMNIPY